MSEAKLHPAERSRGHVPKRWAIIIGINYYHDPKTRLRGCVRDALALEHYLREAQGSAPMSITVLTATTPTDPNSGRPDEDPEKWPTQDNVLSCLRTIISLGSPGDFVYFHYSGHGTERQEQMQLGHNVTRELNLVLLEHDRIGCSYLRDRTLAGAFSRMVEKGLLLTVVLDCCFSGSVVRNDNQPDIQARCVDFDPEIDAASTRKYELSTADLATSVRSSRTNMNLLLRPDGYTILTACGPYEKAHEPDIEGEGKRGALTYYLLQTLCALQGLDATISHQSLHEHIRLRFHISWPRQTPMRYGNSRLSFFGSLTGYLNSDLISVYRTADGRLCLGAGHAHGVYRGDGFALSRFRISDGTILSNMDETASIMKGKNAGSFESDLEEIDPIVIARQETVRWKARMVSCSSSQKVTIRLAENIGSPEPWKEASTGLRFLELVTESEHIKPCMFVLKVNDDNEYEIHTALHTKLNGVPTVPVASNRAMRAVMNILQHLATSKYFESIDNRLPNVLFRQSFTLSSNTPSAASGSFRIRHGDIWNLQIENKNDFPLYMAIFCFDATWEVANIVSDGGGGDYRVVPPMQDGYTGKDEISLKMEVTEATQSCGLFQCENLIKIFILSRPVPFPSMVLPSLSQNNAWSRGSTSSADRLLRFLAELTAGRRGTFNHPADNWIAQNFIIDIAME